MTSISPSVLVTRGIACLAGVVALLLAYPHMPLLLLVVAVLAAFPRTWAPAALMIGVAAIWLIETDRDPAILTPWRLCALALALYYLHVSTALAAVLPHDAHAAPGLYRPWLRRIGLVTVLTVAVALLVASIESRTAGTTSSSAAWAVELIAGIALASGGGALLVYLARRR